MSVKVAVVTRWFRHYGFAEWDGRSCYFDLMGHCRTRFYNGRMIRVREKNCRDVVVGDQLVVYTWNEGVKNVKLSAWGYEDEACEETPVWAVFDGEELICVTTNLEDVHEYWFRSQMDGSKIKIRRFNVC